MMLGTVMQFDDQVVLPAQSRQRGGPGGNRTQIAKGGGIEQRWFFCIQPERRQRREIHLLAMPLIKAWVAYYRRVAVDIKRLLAVVAVAEDMVIEGVPPGMVPRYFCQPVHGADLNPAQAVECRRIVGTH